MKNLMNTVTMVASIAIAALPLAAVATSTHAETVRIRVADLDLNTAQGAARFNARVARTAAEMCSSYRNAGYTACVKAVTDEARENLTAQLRNSRSAQVVVASAAH